MDYYNFFLVVGILGIIVITLLLTKQSVNKTSTSFLVLIYLIYTVYSFQTFIIEAGYLNKFHWFYGWPLLIYSLFSVPVFFYFISVCKDSFKWKWKYVFLFIPFLFSSIDVFILYTKPVSFYNNIVQMAIQFPENRFGVSYGLWPLSQHYFFRHLWQSIFLISIFPMLRRFLNLKYSDELKRKLNNWLLFLYFSILIFSLISTLLGFDEMFNLHIYEHIINVKSVKQIAIFIFYVVIIVIGVMPLYFPTILYGHPQLSVVTSNSEIQNSKLDELNNSKFALDEIDINQKLRLVEKKELYCLNDFNLTACARELNMPSHHLSYFLNKTLEVNFSQYRNSLRIKKAISLIEDGFLTKNTTDALAKKCGFLSRSAFSKTFKTYTKITLSEFVKKST